MLWPTDCYSHPVPKFQPPELLPEEQLGRLAWCGVRSSLRSVYRPSVFGAPAPVVSLCPPSGDVPRALGVKVEHPFSRVRARDRRFSFFAFTPSPVCRKMLTYSSIRVKAFPVWVHAFASSREEAP